MFIELTRIPSRHHEQSALRKITLVAVSHIVRIEDESILADSNGVCATVHLADGDAISVAEDALYIAKKCTEAHLAHVAGLGRSVWRSSDD